VDEELFRSLVGSLKQAVEISKGTATAARITVLQSEASAVEVTAARRAIDAKAVRERTGLSQADFALVMNVSVKTLQNWEQRRRVPTGPAEALLRIVNKDPGLALLALHD
jgi:putative transcriptional regulator